MKGIIISQHLKTFCLLIGLIPTLSIAEESQSQASITNKIDSEMTTNKSPSTTLPSDLIQEMRSYQAENSLTKEDLALWVHVAENMAQLREVLLPLIEEDALRKEKDKDYILALSFTFFMYIMISVGEYSIENNIQDLDFRPLKKLFELLIRYELVNDHPSFDEMLSTLASIQVEKLPQHGLKVTMFTRNQKTEKVRFKKGIPAPRFVISGVNVENGATFEFTELLHPNNKKQLDEFTEDSQKIFGLGGLVLMDSKKRNIPDFLNNFDKTERFKPIMITGEGFSGHGYVKGLKLPSPAAAMETIYLLPGRDGTPAFVRAKSLFIKPFVAL